MAVKNIPDKGADFGGTDVEIPDDDVQETGTSLVPLNTVNSMMEPADLEDDDIEPSAVGQVMYSAKPKFDREDISYPRMRVAQPMTGEVGNQEAKAGQFLLTGNKPADRVTFVPLLYAKTRIFAEGTGGDRKTLCSSTDALNGIPADIALLQERASVMGKTYNTICEGCPFNQWQDNPNKAGKRRPPPCDVNLNYIGYVEPFRQLVQLAFKKTGIRTAQNLNTLVDSRGMGNVAVEMYTVKQTSAASNVPFHVPMFTVIDEPDPALLSKAVKALGR